MQPILTDRVVGLSVGHTSEPCTNDPSENFQTRGQDQNFGRSGLEALMFLLLLMAKTG